MFCFFGFGWCFRILWVLFRRAAPAILMAQGRDPTGWVRPERIVKDMDITTLDERSETTAEKLTEEILAMFALLSPEGKRQYLAILQSICEEAAA